MNSNDIKQEVLNWISEGCDWDRGVMLYSIYGKNKSLLKNIAGKKTTQLGKLTAELCKSVGLDYHQLKDRVPASIRKVMPPSTPIKTLPSTRFMGNPTSTASRSVGESLFKTAVCERRPEFIEGLVEPPETIETTRIEEYPAIIRRVISEYSESFQERSKTHRIMTEMPEGNSQALKTKREQLFGIVKSLSDRLQLLYDVQEVYKSTGFVPNESEIWPTPKEKAKTELPDDLDQLRRMKKNQQSANTKDQSLLDYQSEKQGDVKRPMPNGPRRMKLENRIKARLKMIEEIDYKLLKL